MTVWSSDDKPKNEHLLSAWHDVEGALAETTTRMRIELLWGVQRALLYADISISGDSSDEYKQRFAAAVSEMLSHSHRY